MPAETVQCVCRRPDEGRWREDLRSGESRDGFTSEGCTRNFQLLRVENPRRSLPSTCPNFCEPGSFSWAKSYTGWSQTLQSRKARAQNLFSIDMGSRKYPGGLCPSPTCHLLPKNLRHITFPSFISLLCRENTMTILWELRSARWMGGSLTNQAQFEFWLGRLLSDVPQLWNGGDNTYFTGLF